MSYKKGLEQLGSGSPKKMRPRTRRYVKKMRSRFYRQKIKRLLKDLSDFLGLPKYLGYYW